MARYNVQKRLTLDRLTLKFQLQTREVLTKNSEGLVRDMRDALDSGVEIYKPVLTGLEGKIEGVFEQHRDRVIHVAVSDGIGEVTPGPNPELGLWQRFHEAAWIEDVLSVQLASERDKIARKVQKKAEERKPLKPKRLSSTLFDDYLENLRKAYRSLAREWLEGKGTTDEVIRALQIGLKKTDSSAARILTTETTNYFNETRHDYFSTNTSVDYMQLYAVTDGRISQICEDRHKAVFTIAEAKLKKYMPAFHPHCRTIQRPLLSYLVGDKRIIDEGLALRALHESSWTPIAWSSAA